MTAYRFTMSALIAVILMSCLCFAQKPGTNRGQEIPDKIKAMNFDSVFVLATKYPKSPLIIGYRRVLHLDTSFFNDSDHHRVKVDSVFLFHGRLLTTSGKQVLPYTIYRVRFFKKTGCSRTLMTVLTSDFWYGYDFPASNRPAEYLFDVASEVVRDSGSFTDFGHDRYLECHRADGGTNFLDPCTGYVYDYDDPFTRLITHVWYHRGVLRLLTWDAEGRKICDVDKKPIVPIAWKSTSIPILTANHPAYDKTSDSRIWYYNYDNVGWAGVIDPATGRFGPERVLNFDYARWWFCEGYQSDCIARMRLEGMQNRHPLQRIQRAQIRLTLTDKATNKIVYRQNHWINVGLESGEVGSTQEFQLNQQVFIEGDLSWEAEVLDYR